MAGYVTLKEALEDISQGERNYDVFQGWGFSTGAVFEDVPAGNEVGLIIENPSDSGKVISIESRYTTSGKAFVNKIDSVTVDTNGTPVNSNNRLLSDGSTKATIEKNPSVSGGNVWNQKVVGSGTGGGTVTGGIISVSEIILQEGDNVYFKAVNKSSSEIDISIDVDYFEMPKDEVTELN